MIDGRMGPVVIHVARRARRHRLLGRTVAIGAVAAGLVSIAPRFAPDADAAGLTFEVNSTGDSADVTSSDDRCMTASGACTLRAAMEQANATPGHDTITFDIPGAASTVHRITPAARLPILIDPDGVTIDGYTQGNARPNQRATGTDARIRIELDGPGHASGVEGIYIRSSDNVIRGLAIYDFDKHVRIYGDDPDTAADDIDHDVAYNRIIGNVIGTNAAGTFQAATRVVGADGVHIQHGAFANHIGMPGNEHRNVISGVADRGVGLYDPGTDFNLIQNNIIGLAPDATGATRLGNVNHGIDINYAASANTVGGWSAGEGNVVSGNGRTGIEVSHSDIPGVRDTERNLVVGNLVGTTADGTAATADTANGEYGIYFEGRALCTSTCPPDIRSNVAAANVVVGSRSGIVLSKGAHDNTVVGNWIGVLKDGTDPFAGSPPTTLQQGISIEMGAFDNRIERNTIAHSQRGVHLTAKDPQCPPAGTPDGDGCRAAEWPVFGNTLSMNSITDTSLQGIELRSRGAGGSTYSEGPGASAEVNGGVVAPEIDDDSDTDRIVVETCSGCVVEIFETPDVTGVAWADRGRGERFMLTTTAGTSGEAVFDLRTSSSDPMVILPGQRISATTTDPDGNTSEFSVREELELGSHGLPSNPTTTIPSTTTTTVALSTTTTTTTTIVPPSTTTTTTTTTIPPSTTTSTTVPLVTTTTLPSSRIGGAGQADVPAVRCRASSDC